MNNLKFAKNFSFISFILITIIAGISLFQFSRLVFKSCFSLFLLSKGILDFEALKLILSNPTTYSTILSLILLLIIYKRIINSFFILLIRIYKTNRFIYGLNAINMGRYFVFKSKKLEAFTAGIFSPKVYISRGLVKNLSEEELQAIILHEYAHKNNFDPLKDIFVSFLKRIFPNVGLFKWIFESYSLITELSADIYSHNFLDRKYTIRALYKVASQNDLIIMNFNGASERIKILTNKKRYNVLNFSFALTAIFFLLSIIPLGVFSMNTFGECSQIESCFLTEQEYSSKMLLGKDLIEYCEVRNMSEM